MLSTSQLPVEAPNLKDFLSLGFRPLYIAGCLWALVSVAIWVFHPTLIKQPFDGISWHAHEMLWSFIATIAVGFLLTASANWTGLNPLKGAGLAFICVLWIIARIGYIAGGETLFLIGAIAESIFFFFSSYCLLKVVTKTKNQRNYGLPVMVFGLGLFNILFLRAVWFDGYLEVIEMFNLGLVCMAMIALLIARRVIPFFAMRRVADLKLPMQIRSGHAQLLLSFVAIVFGIFKVFPLMGLALAVTGAISVVQVIRWKPRAVLHNPLLWILYLGYAAMGFGLILAGAQLLGITTGAFSRAAAHVHLIGMGGFSVLIIGMVTRTALGHLGRPLALDKSMIISYYLMIAAVVFRLLAVWPTAYYSLFIDAAAIAWVICFALYLWRFVPMLIRPRF